MRVARFPQRTPFALARAFARDPIAALEAMAATGGDVVYAGRGRLTFTLLRHPDLVRALLTEHEGAFVKSPVARRTRHVLGEGLLISQDPRHRRVRRLVLPAFHRPRLEAYARTMAALAQAEAATWPEGEPVDAAEAMMRLTLEIAAETLFGAQVEADAAAVRRALHTVMRLFRDRMMNPFADLVQRLPLPSNRRFDAARADLDRIVYGFIAAHRAAPEMPTDLLGMLLQAQDEDTGAGLTDVEVRDEAMTLFLAGHETTANALAWTLGLLARHPEEQDRLRDEVAAVLEGRPPAFADVRALERTRAVVAEGMRLYPPAWLFGRQARRAVEMGGFRVPAGSVVTVSPWLLHRDPRWWAEPEAFRPERHLQAGAGQRPRFAYLPFSAGVRGCIGEQFAWTEAVIVLASVVQRGRLAAAGPLPPRDPTVTLRPGGPLWVTLKAGGGHLERPGS